VLVGLLSSAAPKPLLTGSNLRGVTCFGEKSANELEKATRIRKLHKGHCHECKAQLGHALNDRSEPKTRSLLFMSNVSGRSLEVERFNLQLPFYPR
jgi:hypothetical protein